MNTVTSQSAPIAMIDRVASLLQVFDGHTGLTLAQLSRMSDLPRSSTHRILQRLVDLGWVERDGYQYSLGLRMFELGSQVVRRDRIHQVSLPFLHTLHRSTGLTVHLSALVASDLLHLERIGDWPDRGDSWRLGARQPAVLAAGGRALLARLAESEWPVLDFPPPATAHGIRTLRELRNDLDLVVDRGGVAIDHQGCAAGITVVAVPVGPPGSNVRAALSLCGPTGSVPVKEAGLAVRTAAADIWHALSGMPRLGDRRSRSVHSGAVPVRAVRPSVPPLALSRD